MKLILFFNFLLGCISFCYSGVQTHCELEERAQNEILAIWARDENSGILFSHAERKWLETVLFDDPAILSNPRFFDYIHDPAEGIVKRTYYSAAGSEQLTMLVEVGAAEIKLWAGLLAAAIFHVLDYLNNPQTAAIPLWAFPRPRPGTHPRLPRRPRPTYPGQHPRAPSRRPPRPCAGRFLVRRRTPPLPDGRTVAADRPGLVQLRLDPATGREILAAGNPTHQPGPFRIRLDGTGHVFDFPVGLHAGQPIIRILP